MDTTTTTTSTGGRVFISGVTVQFVGGRLLLTQLMGLDTQPHNHAPDVLYSTDLTARRAIINQSRSVIYRTFSDIIANERSRIQDRVVRARLTLRRLRPAMMRARAEIFPNVPHNLAGLTNILRDPAWQNLSRTKDLEGSMYLRSVWGNDGSHNIIFISWRSLELMKQVPILFADGTFYIAPSIDGCYQVFTLVAVYGHTVIPLCWCLMERKTEAAYVAVLTYLRNHMVRWNFIRVVCDFEDAIINAFTRVFGVQVQGCLFHSAHAMVQHAKVTIGIAVLNQFPEVKLIVHLCCALPLSPQHLLQHGLNVIGAVAMDLEDVLYMTQLRPFLEFIQFQWLHHVNRGRTLSVCGSDHRTNNASESNNRSMKRKFGVHHPNIFRFIRELAEFEEVAMDDLQSLNLGIIPSRHRAVSAICNDAHIQELTSALLQGVPTDDRIIAFLTYASHSVSEIVNDALDV
ncbi:hypothetical protein ONE63_000011 [Megalurothrips usitatus]|uniref:MULE transposase domain-containing protein n=1 Tax=Megalurothrips usitatus TaxID=439358 RepID=A0AAV7XY66_9NEOP|nr:hypothetical protein ONE63_000011 [Megalurothrips usitatus]